MPLLEVNIEDKVCEWAEDNGWIAAKLQWLSQTGWPDRTFLKKGIDGKPIIAFIEFKRPKGRRRKKQGYWLGVLLGLGFDGIFCDDATVGINFLKNVELDRYD